MQNPTILPSILKRRFTPEPLRLYQPEEVAKVLEELVPNYQDEKNLQPDQRRLMALAKKLAENCPNRFLMGTRDRSWDTLSELLQEEFPHFQEVTERIGQAYELARLSGTQIQIPPILLLGDPGVGKTHYTRRLAGLLQMHYRAIPMATLTAGFVLSGMHSSWADSKPGIVFSHLIDNDKVANPILLLDELDKASSLDGRHDPLAPLYDLLEPSSARFFRDEYFPLAINASQINWIATANRVAGIPEPILSRMQVIEVPKPTLEERRRIIPRLYANLLEERPWGNIFDYILPKEVLEQLANRCKTPREMRQTLERLCAFAAIRTGKIEEDPLLMEEENYIQQIGLALQDFPKATAQVPFGFASLATTKTQDAVLRKGKRL